MGRPPLCDKNGRKKGPWAPEEDILLVTYIQQHGPGNWRAIPTGTGLLRGGKSCRLRWTNYLRPGIKRGEFTDHEESMIIHLQALLGNRWAAIASYLPQRTDNDIKNYWNTHLMKKLTNVQTGCSDGHDFNRDGTSSPSPSTNLDQIRTTVGYKGQWERRLQTNADMAKQALYGVLSIDHTHRKPATNNLSMIPSSTSTASIHDNSSYDTTMNTKQQTLAPLATTSTTPCVSSTDNISRWLQGSNTTATEGSKHSYQGFIHHRHHNSDAILSPGAGLESFESLDNSSSSTITSTNTTQVPFPMLEKWLFDDSNTLQEEHQHNHHQAGFLTLADTADY